MRYIFEIRYGDKPIFATVKINRYGDKPPFATAKKNRYGDKPLSLRRK